MSKYFGFGIVECFNIATVAALLVQAKGNGDGTSLSAVLKDFDTAYAHIDEKMQSECKQ